MKEDEMLKIVIAVVLIAHGLANLAGAAAPWTKTLQGFKDAPWIFSKRITFNSSVGRTNSLIWLFSSICLVAGGAGLLTLHSWWISAAVFGSVCSLAVILIWWKAIVPGARFGAVVDSAFIVLLTSPLKEALIQALQ
jgi:hypothetical protein